MRPLRVLVLLTSVFLALLPGVARASSESDFLTVYKAYGTSGGVDACKFTATQLVSAQKGVPPDIETYAPDLPGALDAALARRASGACDKPAASTSKGAVAASSAGAGGAGAAGAAGSPAAATSSPAAATSGSAAAAAPVPPASVPPAAGPAAPPTPAPAPDPAAAPAAADSAVAAAAARDAEVSGGHAAPLPLVLLGAALVVAALGAALSGLARLLAWDPRWLSAGRHATAEAGWRASASWAEFGDWVRFGR